MLQTPTEGEFQTLEHLWQHVHKVSMDQGYDFSTLRCNMNNIQIQIVCDGSGTPNPNKNSSKIVTSRTLDCPFGLYARKYAKSTTWTVKVKNPENSHDTTEKIMEHPSVRKFNDQEAYKISQMSKLLLSPRKLQAQLCSQRESERPVILKDIYNQVKKIKKGKLQGRGPLYALIDTLKKEIFIWSSARVAEGHITSMFFTHPLAINSCMAFLLTFLWIVLIKQISPKCPFLILLDSTQQKGPFLRLFV
ncbi:hypothetical protein O181_026222 [Austropuccinia psidii MF-1]|uniref:Uncharacterized protein n=1 Tax=Austropuccinia psidii MF-1 TaxID=1389203 RepID=A0A9Q3H0L0_9BASI|nr:hypothetical protein [Austropuccinia psidii MF-1]